ncbi:MAG: hypothetical protein HWD86_05590 [Kangiellaceae bacterium]|nr:hypothetical protein [Kangiellaceae bacterium]
MLNNKLIGTALIFILGITFNAKLLASTFCFNNLQANYTPFVTTFGDYTKYTVYDESQHFIYFFDKRAPDAASYNKNLISTLKNNLEYSFEYYHCELGFMPFSTLEKAHVYIENHPPGLNGTSPFNYNYITINDDLILGAVIQDKLVTTPSHELFHKTQYKLGHTADENVSESIAALAERLPSLQHFNHSLASKHMIFTHPEANNSFSTYSNALFWQYLIEQVHGPTSQTITHDSPTKKLLVELVEIAQQGGLYARETIKQFINSEATSSSTSHSDIEVMDNFITAKYSYPFINLNLQPKFGFWHKNNYLNHGYDLQYYQQHTIAPDDKFNISNRNVYYYLTGFASDTGFMRFLAAEYRELIVSPGVQELSFKNNLQDPDIRMQVIVRFTDDTIQRYIIDSQQPYLTVKKPLPKPVSQIIFAAYTIKNHPRAGSNGRNFDITIKAN